MFRSSFLTDFMDRQRLYAIAWDDDYQPSPLTEKPPEKLIPYGDMTAAYDPVAGLIL